MPNPIELAPWRSPLSRALHRNRSQMHCRFFQLATVTPEGLPTNRTVVFRGFVEQTNYLKIITDRRSQKIEHLASHNQAEIAWYFTKTREQFRLAGTIEMVNADDLESDFFQERQQTWETISDSARSQFAWPSPTAQRNINSDDFNVETSSSKSPLDSFVLLIFQPHTVDHLELRGNPQNRFIYKLSSSQEWKNTEVNP
ncbi:pyridoxamine 5'-phosphate oxidase-related FMN-binding protein [[Leptolyngbya] sp. PCC 7376]|uniref:Npun_F5749 family FMN-dependent PPOX-type flavoprotein n=1 Tax=[Leptolyngbya] sp. PCC 7376 TaxID=111781 RepID=UPI00029F0F66|nr:Npun_F5749 family FMN-dependent PPOX-type flavoprotein [[Leptolyngbya] sp. PCC 7376]AFY38885.1 pyridoxamine 5'-phosphate oxidase-related FMN-binding protein [[Leptolyngbya] sp. PCC 7376]